MPQKGIFLGILIYKMESITAGEQDIEEEWNRIVVECLGDAGRIPVFI